jgi:hypothetical protein
VFDFGGFVESRIIEAATLADVAVVPLCYQSTADLMPCVKTVSALLPHCPNFAVLVNNTDPVHVPGLKAVLANRFPGTPVLVINRSRYIGRLADDGLTVFDLADLGALNRFHLRHILPQVRDLYMRIDRARS